MIAQQKLADQFGLSAAAHLDPIELFPKRPAPVIVRESTGERSMRMMQWGILASWAKSDAQPRPFNARAETVASSPSFRDAFKARRCLMPASAFFEWKGEKGSKQRFRFTLSDDQPFAFAGIFNTRDDSSSCAIITTTPSSFMADYHNRMPVILDPRDYAAWLDPLTKPADAKALLVPWAGELSAREDARKNSATIFE